MKENQRTTTATAEGMNGVVSEERHGRVLVRQLDVLRQEHPGNCGFHALYNAQCYQEHFGTAAAEGGVPPVPEALSTAVRSCALFWRYFWRSWRAMAASTTLSRSARCMGELTAADMVAVAAPPLQLLPPSAHLLLDASWQTLAVGLGSDSGLRTLLDAAEAARAAPGTAQVCVVAVTGHWVALAVRCIPGTDGACVDIMDSQGRVLCDPTDGWQAAVARVVECATRESKLKPYQAEIYLAQLSDTVRTFAHTSSFCLCLCSDVCSLVPPLWTGHSCWGSLLSAYTTLLTRPLATRVPLMWHTTLDVATVCDFFFPSSFPFPFSLTD